MSGMGLKILSPEIKYYSHITSLYLNHNKLSSIPNEIFQELKCLTTLDLSYNCLTHIPSGISSGIFFFLKKNHNISIVCTLTKLFLNQNRITEIPLEMGCLFRLKELSLEGNPIISPPFSIIQKGTGNQELLKKKNFFISSLRKYYCLFKR